MKVRTHPSGITFAVQGVERATGPLPTRKTQMALKGLLGSGVEACCDYTADCVDRVEFHPLLAAAHFAFSGHRPLVLSPDTIWVAIVQGFAQHVKNHGERLRRLFVGHEGKLEIVIERDDFVEGSPENAWDGAIRDFSAGIRGHLGGAYERLVPDFSTTGPVERAACEVALLDAFRPYFEYRMVCICGIPEVTLEGTADDWRRLREKVEHLAPYGLDWWLSSLRKACDQFARAASGDVDLRHWRDLYKREESYGWDVVNGWLVELVPYLKHGMTGNFTVRNPLLGDAEARVSTDALPGGVSLVPFRCRWAGRSEDEAMELLGGFVGVTQDADTLALRPKLGWAVRRAPELDRSFAGLSSLDRDPPLDGADFDRCIEGLVSGKGEGARGRVELPGDFLLFYKTCNGARLLGGAYRFRGLEEAERVDGLRTEPPADRDERWGAWDTGPWVRFCDLADGSFLALELGHTYEKGWKVARGGPPGASGTGTSPIVAWSFGELWGRVLEGGAGSELPPVGP
jgi:hypothetical protein